VRPANGDHIVRQWLDVQGLPERATAEEQIGRHTRRIWKDAAGETRLEAFSIAGMAHGVPLATVGADARGIPGAFFLEAGISSTALIARSWGLDTAPARKRMAQTESAVGHAPIESRVPGPVLAEPLRAQNDDGARGGKWAAGPGAVIEAAFRAAGLPVPERTGGHIPDPAAIISAAMKAAGLKRT
jgi:hypothetical protein